MSERVQESKKMASVEDVCRLCLSKDNLVWVFDKRFDSTNNMKNVIYITTGVEIYTKDVISQKICNKCCHISIKMFQFRNASQENDRYLKAKYKEMLDKSNEEYKIPNTCVTIKTQNKIEPKIKTEGVEKPNYKMHPSVAALYTVYPGLKLPTICFKSNIEPIVSMEMNAVKDYLKKQRHQQTWNEMTKYDNKIAKKSTSACTKIIATGSHATSSADPLNISSLPLAYTEINNKSDISIAENAHKKDKITAVNVSELVNSNVNNESSSSDNEISEAENIPKKPKRRRLTDSDFFSDPETKDSSSSEPQPSTTRISESSDELCLDKSVPLFICNICNSVHNRSRDLRRHRLKHLWCQFCKVNFKTISAKVSHVDKFCRIKNMMNTLPTVKLNRIELDLRIKEKYTDAFMDFASPSALQSEFVTPEDVNSTDRRVYGNATKGVIEILSDDENVSLLPKNGTTANSKEAKTVPMVTEITTQTELVLEKSTTEEVFSVMTPTVLPPKIEENNIQPSVSIVKPDIRIKNNYVLDSIDSKFTDIRVVKELLTNHTSFELQKDTFSQTELPTNQSINFNERDQTTEFKNLKPLLFVYKIPIVIKKGPFQVIYDPNTIRSQAGSPKKLFLWNDLAPIDVKVDPNTNQSITSKSPNAVSPGITPPVNSLLTKLPNQRVFQNGYKSALCSLSGMVNQVNSHSLPIRTYVPNLPAYPRNTVINTFKSPKLPLNFGVSNTVPTGPSLTYADPRIDPFRPSVPPSTVPGLTFSKPGVNMELKTGSVLDLSSDTSSVPDTIFKKPEQNTGPVINLSTDPPIITGHTFRKPRMNLEPNSLPLLDFSNSTHKMKSPPNVNPFSMLNVPVPVIDQNPTDVTSGINLPENVPVIQDKVTESLSHPLSATTTSDSNKTGPVFGTIRVKSVWELK